MAARRWAIAPGLLALAYYPARRSVHIPEGRMSAAEDAHGPVGRRAAARRRSARSMRFARRSRSSISMASQPAPDRPRRPLHPEGIGEMRGASHNTLITDHPRHYRFLRHASPTDRARSRRRNEPESAPTQPDGAQMGRRGVSDPPQEGRVELGVPNQRRPNQFITRPPRSSP